jgi:shikimate dehydrogenase
VKFTGIIGHPVGHSLSPVFQSAAFASSGLDVRYERWDTPAHELPARIAMLREPLCLGANVTIPHKEAVVPHLDEVDPACAVVGAVNTIVNRGGRLCGYNTDGPGFVRALRDDAAFEPRGRSFLVLGAGGAARGVAFALAREGARQIDILNRSAVRAEQLAADVRTTGAAVRARTALAGQPEYDCVVNCTSVGMRGGPDPAGIPVDVGTLADGTLVVDIVYAPEETALLRGARTRGLPVLGGLPMLIHQGALAFELWTGVPAPVETMFHAARAELAARSAAR